ncbi:MULTISPECIES: ATP phosphoribosyltransferase [unclassified Commensalibacter]|uniref:ATP phosphoribosyltransferase n=1 Tax=unclassified Commensalibacter TaxID=2630218 RepID=UPI0018DC282E|nr:MULTISPECIES: ATP phosphoribosyltransferase [unclassified Commensalibacter]MBH9970399.1 ATP phosphoribosyltransferase [Commensalibacter sp. M0265]MBH9977906.1 ATP phosphoribosyltransferase [Commensalibacter sp. M0266]MBH9993434.1 ATP phosphoribosyltransferase [Commensalibacter sp. M0270]MBI0046930.1 ATP phosphoribosyltransferase [Commensalibacter sp. M0267]MBI0056599.1 ATP phosphoribosyltransferase [Commensalibacter sp. M0268]
MSVPGVKSNPLILALPKGRILKDCIPLLETANIIPEPAFFDKDSRLLRFKTNDPGLDIIRVRSFDVATFVAFGTASLGVCGSDVLMEFDYSDIYAPLDLNIGRCRLSIAQLADTKNKNLEDPARWSQISVATKYPNITQRYFASKGVQADIINLHGAMELAPVLKLSSLIVDLVDTGSTLRANGLQEIKTITQISSRLIINRTALKTQSAHVNALIERFRQLVTLPNNEDIS